MANPMVFAKTRAAGVILRERNASIRSGSPWRRILLPVLVMLLIGLWLDAFVDLNACDYDACRYVKLTHLEYADVFGVDFVSSTTVMHYLYGDFASKGMPFFRAAAFHSVFFTVLVAVFAVENPIVRSPLFIAMSAIPGKEFFLLMAILLIFPASAESERRRSWFFRLIVAVLLMAMSRLPYLAVFGFAYLLAYLYRRRGWIDFALGVAFCVAALMTLMHFVGFNEAVRDIADQEATVAVVNALREYAFGFSIWADIFRFLVYVAYFLLLPVAEAVRAIGEVSAGNFYPAQPFLWAAALEWGIYLLWRRKELAFVAAVISSLLVAVAFPFIHTRYLLPVVLFVQAFAFGRDVLKPFAIWRE